MQILAATEESGRTTTHLFPTWDAYHAATFSPETAVKICPLEIHGHTYGERQSNLRAAAIEAQNTDQGGLSCAEQADVTAFFEAAAKKLGLVREFRENGII